MQKITRAFLDHRITNFKEYSEQYNKAYLDEIRQIEEELNCAQYKIAVVANMSAGKTSLINAFFGKEVLPTYNKATSDCVIYIHSRLPDGEKKAKISFSQDLKKEGVELSGFDENFVRDLKQYAQKDSQEMNAAYKDVDYIELYHPFYNIRADQESVAYNVVLIDTPGPNNTDEYSQKHKDQTRAALAEANMVLFVFSYAELDANLATDEQRLWKPILEKLEKDEDFCVYFVLNKIDFAIDDNIRDIDKNIDNFYEVKKERWLEHESEAIEKLKNKLKEVGVKNPSIFPVSSKYQLLKRLDKMNEDDEDDLDSFQKKHFKRVFGENEWESQLIKYLGIEELEARMNDYIQSQVEQRIHKKIFFRIERLIKEERIRIQTAVKTLSQPKNQAIENLKKVEELLKKEIPQISSQIKKGVNEIREKTQKKIKATIEARVEEKVYKEIDSLVKQAVNFAVTFAKTGDKKTAILEAENQEDNTNIQEDNTHTNWWNYFLHINNRQSIELEGKDTVSVEIHKEVAPPKVLDEMLGYVSSRLLECMNDYKDVTIDIKNIFSNYERENNLVIAQSKEALQGMVIVSLEIQLDNIETELVANEAKLVENLNISIDLDCSLLKYEYRAACYGTRSASVWYKPWTWGDTETYKISDEEHKLIVNVKDLKAQLQKQVQDIFEKLKKSEIEKYCEILETYSQKLLLVFEEFANAKQAEITTIQGQVENIDEEIKKLLQQEKELKLKLQ